MAAMTRLELQVGDQVTVRDPHTWNWPRELRERSARYSGTIEAVMVPNERWGFCPSEGHYEVRVDNYQPTRPLWPVRRGDVLLRDGQEHNNALADDGRVMSA